MFNKRTFLSALAGAGVMLAASPTFAQSYPDRPIKLIVPFPPGGPMDVMARMLGQQLNAALKQPVIVENRAGAGGALDSKAVASAEPDGYTLLWGQFALYCRAAADLGRTGEDVGRDDRELSAWSGTFIDTRARGGCEGIHPV